MSMQSLSVICKRTLRVALVCLLPNLASAEGVSYQTVLDWIQATADAPADGLAPGLYGNDRIGDLGNYVPPGAIDELNFPELAVELTPTRSYRPHALYAQATEKFVNQATIGVDGGLEGYTAGLPFSPDKIVASTPEQAGSMVAWNQVHRWQNYGYRNEALILYVKATADGQPGTQVEGMDGGGTVERSLTMLYHRVYMSKLAQLPANEYCMDVEGSDQLLFKEYIEMLAPFDIAGLKMVIERPLAQTEGDQVNSYMPSERRVRRLSAKERADSWVGTQWTLDDFEGFSGLVMDNTWRYIGQKVVLSVPSSKHATARFHGPMSTIPLDRWQLRPCWVVEAIPRWDGHSYGRRLMFIDQETYNVAMVLIFDRNDALMKIFTMVYEFSEDEAEPVPALSTPRWRASIVINVQNRSANIAQGSKPTEFVDVEPSYVRKLFSVSSLSSGR
jgi:Protein of unknown function (DUF1329)